VTDEAGHLMGIVSRVDLLSVFARDDFEIRDEIVNGVVFSDFSLDPNAFEVDVKSGIVTITGQADSKEVAAQLLEAVRHVEAVVDVRNRISYPHDQQAGKATSPAFNMSIPKG
jgi:osmotically-inducible protein OsmY